MKLDVLKLNLPLFFLFLGTTLSLAAQDKTPTKNMILVSKLIAELGPERTNEFLNRLEKKHTKKEPTPKDIPQPVKSKEPSATITLTPPVHPTAPKLSQPTLPVATIQPMLFQEEKTLFYDMVAALQNYTLKVYDCIKAFLSKSNSDPYRSHVNCFKTQLNYIQTHLQHNPYPQTPVGEKLFDALRKIAKALERSQDLMVQTLDNEYTKMPLGTVALGSNLSQIKVPVQQQRAIINQQIGFLRNELRKAQESDMITTLNNLNAKINETFDYGSDKSYTEFIGILTHRLKH